MYIRIDYAFELGTKFIECWTVIFFFFPEGLYYTPRIIKTIINTFVQVYDDLIKLENLLY